MGLRYSAQKKGAICGVVLSEAFPLKSACRKAFEINVVCSCLKALISNGL